MTVFMFPSQLLHKTAEAQWFPPPIEGHESSLDALEREEEAFAASVRRVAQAPAPEPIGMASAASTSAASRRGSQQVDDSRDASQEDTSPRSPRPRFWNQRQAAQRTTDADVSHETDHSHTQTYVETPEAPARRL